MAGDASDRFAPLLVIRNVAQRSAVGHVAQAVVVAGERERALAAAELVVATAQHRVRTAEARLAELVAAGTTAALVAVGAAFAHRCRAALADAGVELARAAGASGASSQALDAAKDRLAVARGSRELLDRHLARARHGQLQLRERRED